MYVSSAFTLCRDSLCVFNTPLNRVYAGPGLNRSRADRFRNHQAPRIWRRLSDVSNEHITEGNISFLMYFSWDLSGSLSFVSWELERYVTALAINHKFHFISYIRDIMFQAWAVAAGSPRPVKEPLPRKAQSSKKLRPPLRVNGKCWLCVCVCFGCKLCIRLRIVYIFWRNNFPLFLFVFIRSMHIHRHSAAVWIVGL